MTTNEEILTCDEEETEPSPEEVIYKCNYCKKSVLDEDNESFPFCSPECEERSEGEVDDDMTNLLLAQDGIEYEV